MVMDANFVSGVTSCSKNARESSLNQNGSRLRTKVLNLLLQPVSGVKLHGSAKTRCLPGVMGKINHQREERRLMPTTFFVMLILFFSGLTAVNAQNNQLKAFYIFNIIRYVGWGEQARNGNFIISVVGNSDIAQHLKSQSNGRNMGGQLVEVREYRSVNEVNGGHVLFLGSDINPSEFNSTILERLQSANTLIITDAEQAAPRGSSINFVTRNGSLHFELNSGNANRAGLRFSSRLMAMSTAINL